MKKLREKQPPPYLDGRVAGKSIFSRRSMRAPAGRFVQFLLCLVAMMSLSVERASAYDSWQDSWISQWYDAANATIVLDIRVYQSWGGAGDGHCGFLAESGWLKVKVAGYSIKIQGPSGTGTRKAISKNMSRTTRAKSSTRRFPWNGSVTGLSRTTARAPIS